MIRRALLFTLIVIPLQLVLTSLLGFANAVLYNPKILVQPQTIEFFLWLLPPLTLIAFLLVLYRELSGHVEVSRRRAFALAAASGKAVHLVLSLWQLRATGVALSSLTPEIRAQFRPVPDFTANLVHAAIWNVIPTVIWIAFLLIFWRKAVPLVGDWTGRLSAFLCVISTVQGILGVSRLVSRLQHYYPDWLGRPVYTSWNLIISPAVFLAASCAAPYFLFSVWWAVQTHNPAEPDGPSLAGSPHATDSVM
jgi:hypothetical protein